MTSKTFERKLSAILSADVAGYSRLMGSDEELTITTLTGHREMMTTLIEDNKGRVIDSPGDNLLAAFASVTQAVDCAVEIQREMAERNEELPDDRKMKYRIGVNLGDVIEEGERIYGDGVNIAARLEALAEPGGICISGFVYNQVKNRLKLEYEFLGEQSVKNIKEPVPVYRVLSFPGAAAHRVIEAKKWVEGESVASSSEKPSIAVIPFLDLSREKDQEYFVDGLSEELINSLCQIPDLTVIARISSFCFKGSNKTVQEIASVLGVENILEGSVRKAGNSLRITSQLVKAVDGSHLWSKTYNRELKDIFEVQEDIATAVADELKVTLGIGKSLKQLGGTDNVEAYEHYLVAKGQQNWNPSDPLVQNQILPSLDAALALDPKFALAWAYKSLIHYYISLMGPLNQSYAERDASLSAALKAIELEPNLADGYHSLGCLQSANGVFIEAESSYSKGLELSSDAFSYIYAQYLVVGKNEKAKGILEKMVRKDPLNQELRGHYLLGLGLLGNMQRAEKEYKRGMALFGDEWWLGNFYITQLRLSKDNSISRDDIVVSSPIYDSAKQHLESPEKALTELHRIYSDVDNLKLLDIGDIAIWAAYFGDSELAMAAIEKFIKMNNFHFWYCWYPVMREVRQLPRFKELAKEFGLVDYWNKFGWPDFCHQLENGDFKFD